MRLIGLAVALLCNPALGVRKPIPTPSLARTHSWVLSAMVASLIVLTSGYASSGAPLINRWWEAIKQRQWVTAFLDSTRPDAIPSPVDLMIVKAGDSERVVYRARAHDVELGGPIVSRDGTRLAFLKVEQASGRFRQAIYSMKIDGSDIRELIELTASRFHIKGAYIGPSPLAWSHDNGKLALVGAPSATPTTSPPSSSPPLRHLLELDPSSGRFRILMSLGRRPDNIVGPVITSQAWAPDNRRLVYMSDNGHVRILDVVTSNEIDLGAGFGPTWSPDGRFIVFQLPSRYGDGHEGDLVRVPVASPQERSVLLSNLPSLFSFWTLGYVGPAVWLPDSRLIKVNHVAKEISVAHVVDTETGETAKLPPRFDGPSWGGRP